MAKNTRILVLVLLFVLTLAILNQNAMDALKSTLRNSNVDGNFEVQRTLGVSCISNEDVTILPCASKQNSTGKIEGDVSVLPVQISPSSFASSIDHIMCKNYTLEGDAVDPTTIFSPGDTAAMCLVRTPVNGSAEFKWYYRSDTSEDWVFCYDCATTMTNNAYAHMGCEGHLLIANHELYYPRAYKVDFYLNGTFSFSDYFEITNGGLESPRTCQSVDANGYPINAKSQFTIGVDTSVYYSFRFDRMAYFNEELGVSHNFTTVWIQPGGSIFKTYSGNFGDYKDANTTWNYWESNFITDNFIIINSSTPIGNWKVQVYLDSYYEGSSKPYGPVATTSFVIGNSVVPDWTFMVYLDADYPGEKQNDTAGINTFLNIAKVGSSPRVNMIIQMDKIAGWWTSGVWADDTRYGNWSGCKRFYVTSNMTPTASNAILDLGNVDMGDSATLKDFIHWTMNCYPANHYCLVLWDHGAGFTGLCTDATSNNDYLSMHELSQSFEGFPVIDLEINDACSMSMIEVAYQIKDYANIMVGPEELGFSPAPYNWYLSALTDDPSMSPSQLATAVVSNYIIWCNQVHQYLPQTIQNATLSAIDLTRVLPLSTAIDDFALVLKNEETPYSEEICFARNQTRECPGPYEGDTGCYADIYDFAQHLNTSNSGKAVDKTLQSIAGRVMTAINESTIVAENMFLPNNHGLAMFFPSTKANYSSLENAYENTAFAASTCWNEFLQYHLSGSLLTIQTIPSSSNIPLTVTNNSGIPVIALSAGAINFSHLTDEHGEARIFLFPAQYTINLTSEHSIGTGARLAFVNWENNETSNPRTLFINGTTTLAASYHSQYQLSIKSNVGTTVPSLGTQWYDAHSTFSVNATAPPLAFSPTQEQYVLLGWNGTGSGSYSGMADPGYITMNGPINETVTWRHEYYLAVESSYGLPAPSSGWIEAGASIQSSVSPPTSEPTDVRHVSTGWSGTGSISESGTDTFTNILMTQPSSIIWNWKTQYHVYINTDPAGLNPQPDTSSSGPWYDEGVVLTCTAQNESGKVFDHWTVGDSMYETGLYCINISVYGPYRATAHYIPASAWWSNLFVPSSAPFVLAFSAAFTCSLVWGIWFRTRRNHAKRMSRNPTPSTIPKLTLPGRISTGCATVDSLLCGGIPEGCSVALTSPSCDEKDLLVRSFLTAGARKGETTFCVTINPTNMISIAKECPSNFHLFVCNPRADTIVESLPNVNKLKGTENLTEISITLAKVFRSLNASQTATKRACIEIVSDVLLQHRALQTRRWLKDLIPEFKSEGFTTLATVNPQMHSQEEIEAILDLFEGQIVIFEKTTINSTKFAKIKKLANQKYLDYELPLNSAQNENEGAP